ncbi:MAG TPA: DUF998 domain-containing protein [Lysobacter sp.]|jgi:hypothetical protein|nr:DUF998 domain-containing protein [Lysobacter sp.]
MNLPLSSVFRYAGWIAAGLCAAAAIGFSAAIDGYSHASYPLALLGAKAMPRAFAFNLLAFVIPGLLVAWIVARLRTQLSDTASWAARIGARMLLLSAFAFVAQGVLPLDLEELEGVVSGWHATVWMLWWIAYTAGGVSLATGLRRSPVWRSFAATTMIAAVTVPVFALFVSQLLPAGFAQRLAFAIWFAWAIAAGHAVSRIEASGSGSSPTTRK